MSKWADFLISAVRYDTSSTSQHISHLRVHSDEGDSIKTATTWTKNQVVISINNGQSFKTMYKKLDGKWYMGEDVRVIVIDGEYYLRTDANRIKADNLGELPEF